MLQAVAPAASLEDRLISLRRRIDGLELEFSQLAAEYARCQDWDDEGFLSALHWIRVNCKMTSNAAADRINVGQRLEQLQAGVQAVETGEIGFAHLTVMARTASAVGDAFDEAKLLQLAREHTPGKFHFKCLHHRHSVNAEEYAQEQAERVEQRWLKLSTAEDGCLLLSGCLDPVGGAVVRSALEPLARPSGAHDDRNLEQRNADALVERCSKDTKVQIQVTSSVETLLNLVGAPGAENEFSLPISAKTVERWACDCSLSRVLLQDSVVIDVGRSERTIKGPRRRALIARDRHCQWPGCERPASWCEAHHVDHWLHGGGGEIENQILLCTRHHWKVHEGGWQLVKTDDGRVMPIAPTVTFGVARGPTGSQ